MEKVDLCHVLEFELEALVEYALRGYKVDKNGKVTQKKSGSLTPVEVRQMLELIDLHAQMKCVNKIV